MNGFGGVWGGLCRRVGADIILRCTEDREKSLYSSGNGRDLVWLILVLQFFGDAGQLDSGARTCSDRYEAIL